MYETPGPMNYAESLSVPKERNSRKLWFQVFQTIKESIVRAIPSHRGFQNYSFFFSQTKSASTSHSGFSFFTVVQHFISLLGKKNKNMVCISLSSVPLSATSIISIQVFLTKDWMRAVGFGLCMCKTTKANIFISAACMKSQKRDTKKRWLLSVSWTGWILF